MAVPAWSRKGALEPSTDRRNYSRRASRAQLTQVFTALLLGASLGLALSSAHSFIGTTKPPAAASANKIAPRGQMSDILWRQGLSHVAFHQPSTKARLARMVRRHGTVGVVGVEYGVEVLTLASAGFEVHAFEPMTAFHDKLRDKVAGLGLPVHLYRAAAGATASGTLNLRYKSGTTVMTETVRRARFDDLVSDPLDVLSVDVQGAEIGVLRGAPHALARTRSLWLEIFPCSDNTRDLLALLDKNGFMVMDFVPWGSHRAQSRNRSASLHEIDGVAAHGFAERPTGFEEYCRWFCKLRTEKFRWLQSDIIAVRRDIITPDLMLNIATLGNDAFVDNIRELKALQKKHEMR